MDSPVTKRQCESSSSEMTTAATASSLASASTAKSTSTSTSTSTMETNDSENKPKHPPDTASTIDPKYTPKQKPPISQKDLLKPPPSNLHPAEAARRAAAAKAYAMQGSKTKLPTPYYKQKQKSTTGTKTRKRKSPMPTTSLATHGLPHIHPHYHHHPPPYPNTHPHPSWWHGNTAKLPPPPPKSTQRSGKFPTAPVPTWTNHAASSQPNKQVKYDWSSATAKLDATLRPYFKTKSITTTNTSTNTSSPNTTTDQPPTHTFPAENVASSEPLENTIEGSTVNLTATGKSPSTMHATPPLLSQTLPLSQSKRKSQHAGRGRNTISRQSVSKHHPQSSSPYLPGHYQNHPYHHQHSNGSCSTTTTTTTTTSHQSLIMANLNHIDDEEYLKLLRSLGTDEPDNMIQHSNREKHTNNGGAAVTGLGADTVEGLRIMNTNEGKNGDNPDDDDDDEEYQGDDHSSEEDDEEEGQRPSSSSSASQRTADPTTNSMKDQSSKGFTKLNPGISTPDGVSLTPSKELDQCSLDDLDLFLDHNALEEELGSLFQEDLEATVNTLLNGTLDFGAGKGKGAGTSTGASATTGVVIKASGSNAIDVPAVVAAPDGIIDAVVGTNPDGLGESVTNMDSNGAAPNITVLDSNSGVAVASRSPPSTPIKPPSGDPTDIALNTTTISNSNHGGSNSMASTPSHDHGSNMTALSQSTTLGTAKSSPHTKSPSSVATAMTPGTMNSTTTNIVNTPTPNTTPNVTTVPVVQQPQPTEQQILQLQDLMSQHYQITLQQAVLAVRAAHGNKCQKDHHYFITTKQKQQLQQQQQQFQQQKQQQQRQKQEQQQQQTQEQQQPQHQQQQSQEQLQQSEREPPQQKPLQKQIEEKATLQPEIPVYTGSMATSDTVSIHQGKNVRMKASHPPLHHKYHQHHELLLQRQKEDYYFGCAETSDDLIEIIDGAVTMLQDLDKNRRDGIRYSIQMHRAKINAATAAAMKNYGDEPSEDKNGVGEEMVVADMCGDGESGRRRRRKRIRGSGEGLYPTSAPSAARSILGAGTKSVKVKKIGGTTMASNDSMGIDVDQDKDKANINDSTVKGMLTRSAFSRTLQQQQNDSEDEVCCGDGDVNQHTTMILKQSDHSTLNSNGCVGVITKPGGVGSSNISHPNSGPHINTIFGVKALTRLDQTFAAIDNSLSAKTGAGTSFGINILMESGHGRACELLLQHARADYDRSMIPGYRDISELVSYRSDIIGDSCPQGKLSFEKEVQLRKCRAQFTAAEDNLLLRGVNLYGEKEWTLLSDRFLPDRSVSIIAQRYWRLCYLIYRGNGVKIDELGNLETPPKHPNGVADFDEETINATLKPVKPPALYNLYRWSLEEDITILRSVPLMGRMFAEIAKRLIPHRNRGALRKRYQVLERRVKGSMKREKKIITGEKEKKKANSTMVKATRNGLSTVTNTSRESKKNKTVGGGPVIHDGSLHVYHGFGTGQHPNRMEPRSVPHIQKLVPPSGLLPNHGAILTQPPTQPSKAGFPGHLPTTLPRLPPPGTKSGALRRGNPPPMPEHFAPWQRPASLARSVRPPFAGRRGRGRGRVKPYVGPGRHSYLGTVGKSISSLDGQLTAVATDKATDDLNPQSLLPKPITGNGTSSSRSNSNNKNNNNSDTTNHTTTVDDASSRLQVEEIIDGEWSQMSSIRNIIDGGESIAVTKIKESAIEDVSYKGPLTFSTSASMSHSQGPSVEKLPDMEFDDSCSGLSMLNSVGRSQSQTESIDHCPTTTEGGGVGKIVRRKKHESIMSSVLGRAKEQRSKKVDTKTDKNLSPSPDKAAKSASNFNAVAESTPGAGSSKPNQLSMDGFNFSNFTLGDNNLLSPGKGGTRATAATSVMQTPTSIPGYSQAFPSAPSTTGEFNMNSLMEPDFCAISALNQLSNSSVQFHNNNDTNSNNNKNNNKINKSKNNKNNKNTITTNTKNTTTTHNKISNSATTTTAAAKSGTKKDTPQAIGNNKDKGGERSDKVARKAPKTRLFERVMAKNANSKK